MGRRSKVEQLPEGLRQEIHRLLVEKRLTYEQIEQHMRALGADVSSSGVHRYAQSREKANERIRLAREMTIALGKELQDLPEEDHDRAANELIMATLVQAATNLAQLDEPDVEETMLAATALDKLSSSKKKNVEAFALRAKIREQERARLLKEQTSALERVGTERGLSTDLIASIKADILGVAKEQP